METNYFNYTTSKKCFNNPRVIGDFTHSITPYRSFCINCLRSPFILKYIFSTSLV
jgi:hypothetical protein